LASDVPGLARVTDLNLVNPWGMSFSPTGPFWFADNGTSVSDLIDGRGEPVPLVITVPGAGLLSGTPTGTVFNGGPGFVVSENGFSASARFLFAAEDGTITGWSESVDLSSAVVAVDNSASGAVYKGLALAADSVGSSFLYATDFGRGEIDVFDQDFRPVVRPGSFRDPDLPDRYAPFNIQTIDNMLYVTYARKDADGKDDVPGPGRGFIDVYDTGGNLIRRLASQGPLDSPWGLAQAPADFGLFGGALLVGNRGDGRINAYDSRSGAFLGPLTNGSGAPIIVPGLWGLTFGNGNEAGDADTLFLTAGVGDEEHGLFGAIQPAQRRGEDTAGSGIFDPQAPGEPGDYPLPPRGGPALLNPDDGPPRAAPILLPLQDSPLALAPTLSVVPQPEPQLDPPATRVVALPLGWFVGTQSTDSHTTVVLLTASDPPLENCQDTSLVLNLGAFVNSSATPAWPGGKAAGQRPDVNWAIQSVDKLMPVPVPPFGQLGEAGLGEAARLGLEPVFPVIRPRSAGDEVPENDGAEATGRGNELAGRLLVALGFPLIYTLCRRRPARDAVSAARTDGAHMS
jgi:uncharacterized protein (TIGR03118 family)